MSPQSTEWSLKSLGSGLVLRGLESGVAGLWVWGLGFRGFGWGVVGSVAESCAGGLREKREFCIEGSAHARTLLHLLDSGSKPTMFPYT